MGKCSALIVAVILKILQCTDAVTDDDIKGNFPFFKNMYMHIPYKGSGHVERVILKISYQKRTFFLFLFFSSTKHESFPAHKCENAIICWQEKCI